MKSWYIYAPEDGFLVAIFYDYPTLKKFIAANPEFDIIDGIDNDLITPEL